MSGSHVDEKKNESSSIKKIGTLDLSQADIERLKVVPVILDQIYRSVLKEGTDYGKIPGTPKPSLWKPGAELLAGWLRITIDCKILKQEEDYAKPFFNYIAEARVYDQNGFYIGNGFGSCNSREPQYAFRWISEKDILVGMEKEKLLRRSDGKYRIDASANELFGQANAILKKAKKRAFVDAILTVTGASRIFTQDIGEDGEEEKAIEAKGEIAPSQSPSTANEDKQATASEGWEVRVPLAKEAPDDPSIKQVPLIQGTVRVGVINVLGDMTEASIVPEMCIPANDSTIANFLIPRVLEPMALKHAGIEYQVLSEEGILRAIVLRGPLDDQLVKDIVNAARWAFSRALEKTKPNT